MYELENIGGSTRTSPSYFLHIFGGIVVLVYVHLTILDTFIEAIDSLKGSVLPSVGIMAHLFMQLPWHIYLQALYLVVIIIFVDVRL
jgi:hypothetical protein